MNEKHRKIERHSSLKSSLLDFKKKEKRLPSSKKLKKLKLFLNLEDIHADRVIKKGKKLPLGLKNELRQKRVKMKKDTRNQFKKKEDPPKPKETNILSMEDFRSKKSKNTKKTDENASSKPFKTAIIKMNNYKRIWKKSHFEPKELQTLLKETTEKNQLNNLSHQLQGKKEDTQGTAIQPKQENTKIINLENYKQNKLKKKWKKDFIFNASQVAGMAVFLFMIMMSLPKFFNDRSSLSDNSLSIDRGLANAKENWLTSLFKKNVVLKNQEDSMKPLSNKKAVALKNPQDWFNAIPNKGLVIKNTNLKDNRIPAETKKPNQLKTDKSPFITEDPVKMMKKLNPKNFNTKKF